MTGPAPEGGRPSAAPPARLRKRADFVRAAKGARVTARAFALQARKRLSEADEDEIARVGFTVTKKTGNSVVRNRIRRRLREAVRLGKALPLRPDHDYVLIARREALTMEFRALGLELERALQKLNDPKRAAGGSRPTRST
jgi:ribonuclease P protein component